jgi:hypothetical protein
MFHTVISKIDIQKYYDDISRAVSRKTQRKVTFHVSLFFIPF